MRSRRLAFIVAGVLIAGVTLGSVIVSLKARPENQPVRVSMDFCYAVMTREEMIDQADLIFVGKVVNITPTRWNQDSGEYWDEDETPESDSDLMYHEIELAILQPIVDRLGAGEKVVITVLGNSPVGPQPEVRIHGQPVIIEDADSPAHDLKVGDQALIFAEQREIAWRGGGMHPVLTLMGYPQDSYLIQGEDGLYHFWRSDLEPPLSLEELLAQIEARREILAQP